MSNPILVDSDEKNIEPLLTQEVADANEQVPLLPHTRRNIQRYRHLKNALSFFIQHLAALPTSIYAGIAAASFKLPPDQPQFSDVSQLTTFLGKTGPLGISFFFAATALAQLNLYYMNTLFLIPSLQSSAYLIRDLTLTPYYYCTHKTPPGHITIRPCSALTRDSILFSLALATSLIFAAMGSEAFGFLGKTGIILGFVVNWLGHFSTRFNHTLHFLQGLSDKTSQKRHHSMQHIQMLDLSQLRDINETVTTNSKRSRTRALSVYIDRVEHLKPSRCRRLFFNLLLPSVGYTLVAAFIVPLFAAFIPKSIKGAEILSHLTIGANCHYKNAASFILGIFLTSLTGFFYSDSLRKLPHHLGITALKCQQYFRTNESTRALKLLTLTTLAMTSSYATSLPFLYIANEAQKNDWINYLGAFSKVVPPLFLMTVMTMLWSHNQFLINQNDDQQGHNDNDITYINRYTALTLLARGYSPKPRTMSVDSRQTDDSGQTIIPVTPVISPFTSPTTSRAQ